MRTHAKKVRAIKYMNFLGLFLDIDFDDLLISRIEVMMAKHVMISRPKQLEINYLGSYSTI